MRFVVPRVLLLAPLFLSAPNVHATGARALIELNIGYGTPRQAYVQGRVVRDKRVRLPAVHRSGADNLVDGIKLLESDELAGVIVEVTLGERQIRTTTDDEGLFEVSYPEPGLPVGRHPFAARVVDTHAGRSDEATSWVMLVPEAEDHVVLVSDFDDTVVISHVRNKLRMAMNALLRNALQLKPVHGVADAYQQALDEGVRGVMYLSGSPLALFPRIAAFLRRHDIPEGPLLLKNYGTDPLFEQRRYKRRHLEVLLERLPASRLLLVGDSGEHDPEIYADLRRDYPHRVAGIVIRKIPGDDSPTSRFVGMTVVDDFRPLAKAESPFLLGGLVDEPRPRGTMSEGEAATEGNAGE